MGVEEQLLAVTPIDGRYADKIQSLTPILSEFGLIKRRVAVEAGWVATLGSGVLPDVDPLGQVAQAQLDRIATDFSVQDAAEVKQIERTTNHDVKAVEMWLRDKLGSTSLFGNYLELIHFGATSEDINNLAYATQLRDTREDVLLPNLALIGNDLLAKAHEYADLPMLARTHGQAATPTTLGKEMRVFSQRTLVSHARLAAVSIFGKFNGATGNYNAMAIAYPEVDWRRVSTRFIRSLGLAVSPITTQIEPHDWTAEFCDAAALSNTAMTDLARDMWSYISLGYFTQTVKTGEVGSSTMPHKVNPIDFENAEANLGAANSLLHFLATKLPISRLQRDLSDSSAQRTFGEAFGHTLVAHASLRKGLSKVHANPDKLAQDLQNEYSVLTEAVQTVMRRYGVAGAYDLIKAVSRGKAMTRTEYLELVESLSIPDDPKARLRELTPSTYIGYAASIARST